MGGHERLHLECEERPSLRGVGIDQGVRKCESVLGRRNGFYKDEKDVEKTQPSCSGVVLMAVCQVKRKKREIGGPRWAAVWVV